MKRLVVVLALVLAACSGGGHGSASPPTTKPRPTHPAAPAPPQAPLSARVALPSREINAGSSMSGSVIVANNTGNALHGIRCGDFFQVTLGNDTIRPNALRLECAMPFTIPVGRSSYPVTVIASYPACNSDGPQGAIPACQANGQPPALPPGDYRATLFQTTPLVPPPPPTTVRVTPRRSRGGRGP